MVYLPSSYITLVDSYIMGVINSNVFRYDMFRNSPRRSETLVDLAGIHHTQYNLVIFDILFLHNSRNDGYIETICSWHSTCVF